MAEGKLTFGLFADDHASDVFDNVGKAADRAGSSMRDAGDHAKSMGKGFERATESADTLDTRAMGFRDTMTGVQDTMGGVSKIAHGDLFEGFLTLGMGVGDLGSAFVNFIIPNLARFKNLTIVTAIQTRIAAVASRVWAAGQWLLNAALSANPIGLVVIAVAALAAGFVWAYRHSETFRAVVQGAFRVVGAAASWLWHSAIEPAMRGIGAAFAWSGRLVDGVASGITGAFRRVVGFVSSMPGRIRSAAAGMWNGITAAFRGAINTIIAGWNRLQFTVPGFNAGPIHYGGFTLGVPDIPYLAAGGIVTGPTVAMLGESGREAVIPLEKLRSVMQEIAPSAGLPPVTINLYGSHIGPRDVMRELAWTMRTSGR